MAGYFMRRDSARHWLAMYSATGCNSYVIETFTNAAACRAYVRKMNSNMADSGQFER